MSTDRKLTQTVTMVSLIIWKISMFQWIQKAMSKMNTLMASKVDHNYRNLFLQKMMIIKRLVPKLSNHTTKLSKTRQQHLHPSLAMPTMIQHWLRVVLEEFLTLMPNRLTGRWRKQPEIEKSTTLAHTRIWLLDRHIIIWIKLWIT